jgi:hypothetical protein
VYILTDNRDAPSFSFSSNRASLSPAVVPVATSDFLAFAGRTPVDGLRTERHEYDTDVMILRSEDLESWLNMAMERRNRNQKESLGMLIAVKPGYGQEGAAFVVRRLLSTLFEVLGSFPQDYSQTLSYPNFSTRFSSL